MAAKLYRATANFPTLGDEAHQEVQVEAGNWSAAMGLAARRLKALTALKTQTNQAVQYCAAIGGWGSRIEPYWPVTGATYD
jgi:hypothetical protein